MSDTSCANQTAHRGVSDYVRRARSVTDRLHRFAFEVNEEVRALSRNRRVECAIPKGSANGWPERDRFLELLSPSARSRAVVVLPSPLRAAFTFRVVAASKRRATRIEAERKARAFRRRALRWFGVELEPGRAQELPAEPEPAPWPPDGSDLGHLAALPAPRVPNAELEWRLCEAPALLGCRGAGGFERGGSANPADTWPLHQALLQTAGYLGRGSGPVARARRIDAAWRRLPKWAQDVITVYYSTDRLDERQARTREDAPHRRAHALQAMSEGARLGKVGSWLRALGVAGVTAETAVRDAHRAWEAVWGAERRKRRESAREAARRARAEAVAAFAQELGG
jgi:hypothetical protein